MESNVNSGKGQGFRLAGFPKEFERNFWETLDKRYYSILLVTFLLMYSIAFILASRDWQLSEEDLSKLKEQVRQMVYEAEIITTEPEEVEVSVLETGTGGGEEEEIGEEGQKRASESATERLQRQRSGRASRAARTRQMEQDVRGSGILAIATAAGGGGGVSYGDVLKGLAGGAGGVGDVGSVVEGTAGIAAASGRGDRTRVAKGGGYRGNGEGIGIDDLIEGEGVGGGASFSRKGDVTLGEGGVELSGSAAGTGSRDAQSILSVINQNKTSVEYCYQKYLKLNPSLSGEIYLEITISPEGTVSSVRVLKSTLPDKDLESCITRTVNRWRGFGKIDPSLGAVKTRFKYIF